MVWKKLIDVSILKIHCKKVSNIAKECKYKKVLPIQETKHV